MYQKKIQKYFYGKYSTLHSWVKHHSMFATTMVIFGLKIRFLWVFFTRVKELIALEEIKYVCDFYKMNVDAYIQFNSI